MKRSDVHEATAFCEHSPTEFHEREYSPKQKSDEAKKYYRQQEQNDAERQKNDCEKDVYASHDAIVVVAAFEMLVYLE